MTPLENERFRELARQVAAGAASDAARRELETMLRQEPVLKEEFDEIRKEARLLREALPLLEALDAPARPFPAYARERLQTKVREALGRKVREGPGGFLRGSLAPKKVLLVADEKSFTTLLKINLEQTGNYEVRVENWAEDAVAAAKEFRPDLVLLDIIMPRLPGGNVAALIEAEPVLKGTPIVFLTAAVRRHQVEEHEGVISDRPCLAKPASLEAVIAIIDKYARKRAG